MTTRTKKLRDTREAKPGNTVGDSLECRQPNVVFIIADDLTAHAVRALGNTEVRTPNIDRLMAQGFVFRHCFHQGSWTPAVCIASRTMLFTGMTAFRAQRAAETVLLWPQVFGDAGYDTHSIGKWHLSRRNLSRSFKTLGLSSLGGMFDSTDTDGVAYNRPTPGNQWTPWDTSQKGHWLHLTEWKPNAKDRIVHSAELWAAEAVAFIRSRGADRTPFFLHVGFHLPHDPRQSRRSFVKMYPPGKVAVPKNFAPCHPFDQGDYTVRDELLSPFPRTPEAVQLHRSEYYAAVTMLDAQIGRIADALDASGQRDRTIIIVTSDHGLAVGEHGLMGKQNLYDCSVRVPLVFCGPGIAAGSSDALVYQHSIFATVCDLAGIATPSAVEFPSLAGLLRADAAGGRESIFSFYRHFQRSLRTKRHKLIVYPQAGVTQLFDLQSDPWETANLAALPQYAGIKRQMLAALIREQRKLGDALSLASVK